MSYKYVDMALDIVDFCNREKVGVTLTPGEHRTLIMLARYADDSGRNCFPGLSLLSQKLGLSERQTQATITSIESKELIEKYERRGKNKANVYRLVFPSKLIALNDIRHKRKKASIEHGASKIVKSHIKPKSIEIPEPIIEIPKELQDDRDRDYGH